MEELLSTVATLDHDLLSGVQPDDHHDEAHDLVGSIHIGGFYVESGTVPTITDGDLVAPVDGIVAMTYDTDDVVGLIWVRTSSSWTAVEVT